MIKCFEPRDLVRLEAYKKILIFCEVPRTQAEIDGLFTSKNLTTIRRYVLDLKDCESGSYLMHGERKVNPNTRMKRTSKTYVSKRLVYNELDLEPAALGKPVVHKEPEVLPPYQRPISFDSKEMREKLRKQDELIRLEHKQIQRHNYPCGSTLSSVFL